MDVRTIQHQALMQEWSAWIRECRNSGKAVHQPGSGAKASSGQNARKDRTDSGAARSTTMRPGTIQREHRCTLRYDSRRIAGRYFRGSYLHACGGVEPTCLTSVGSGTTTSPMTIPICVSRLTVWSQWCRCSSGRIWMRNRSSCFAGAGPAGSRRCTGTEQDMCCCTND